VKQEKHGRKNVAAEFCLQSIFFHADRVLLHTINQQHGIDSFISPLKEVMPWIFVGLWV
jgi:hypothetical protein